MNLDYIMKKLFPYQNKYLILHLAKQKGLELTEKIFDYKKIKESQYNLLADEMRKHLDMEAIYGILEK